MRPHYAMWQNVTHCSFAARQKLLGICRQCDDSVHMKKEFFAYLQVTKTVEWHWQSLSDFFLKLADTILKPLTYYKLYLLSRFCILFFKEENLLIPLAPLRGEIDICAPGLFCTKFNFEQLLFKPFFEATCIFGSVEPQTRSTFPFLHIIIFLRWESSELHSSTRGGGGRRYTHMRSRTFLYKIKFRTTFLDAMCVFVSVESKTESTFPFFYTIIYVTKSQRRHHAGCVFVYGQMNTP